MNNKEFLSSLSSRVELNAKELQRCSEALSTIIAETLEDGDVFAIQHFGNFEVKKKLERVLVNPATKQRMLVPPRLLLGFKPANSLKEKFK